MAEAGQVPDEDCVDDRRVAETLIELIEFADLVLFSRVKNVSPVSLGRL